VSTGELVVVGPPGSTAAFDFMVWGLRIGFEELAPVQAKEQEAFIPSMKDHRDRYAEDPSLRSFNALARFSSMERTLRGLDKDVELDLGRADALREAIHEFDPAVDSLPQWLPPRTDTSSERHASSERTEVAVAPATSRAAAPRPLPEEDGSTPPSAREQVLQPAPAMDDDGNVTARSFRSERSELALELPSAGGIEPGEVVALDPETGLLVAAAASGDARVVGVAVDEAGVILGGTNESDATRARVVFSGVTRCRVDAGYGVVMPGDLLTASATPGHAMRASDPMPGSVVAKALEPLEQGQGTIRALVMLR